MISIGKRLQAIAAFVDQGAIVADVGSDHGKLLVYLAEKSAITKGYGIENKTGPFQTLEQNLKNAESQLLEAVFEDGINNLAADVDTLVLAGLGGDTIIAILKAHPDKLANIKTIITDSHTALGDVRRYIVALGYLIKNEKLIMERNKYYEITKFVKCTEPVTYSDFEYRRGPMIIRTSEFKPYAKKEIAKIDALLKKDLPSAIKKVLNEEREILKTYEN